MRKIAITTTLPLEILLASNSEIIDLNNRFVTSPIGPLWLQRAEREGFPKSLCAWIKGLYGACLDAKPDLFIAVTEGDCSNTKALNAILEHKGINSLLFGYPQEKTEEKMGIELRKLADALEVEWDQVLQMKQRLLKIRSIGKELDRLTYETDQVSGFENHLWLVSFSDMDGNLEQFEKRLSTFVEQAKVRKPFDQRLRLAYVGVPPMMGDLYEFVESRDARVVFNEVQRQFAMPFALDEESLESQYTRYTYPYDIEARIKDINEQIKERRIDGVIHYTQAFCHRALDDVLFKDKLEAPVLTIEGDQATTLDARTKLRLEAFIDMLEENKG